MSSIRQRSPILKTPFCYQRSDGDLFHDFLGDATWIDNLSLDVDNGTAEILLGQKAASIIFYLLENSNTWYNCFDSCYILRESLFSGSTSGYNTDPNRRHFVYARNNCKHIIKEAKSLFAHRIWQRIGSKSFVVVAIDDSVSFQTYLLH